MAQPYVGQMMMFAGTFAPAGWMLCQGQLVPISENETLFNLIGTTYGGDGQSTFALPDMQGRIPIHMGTGGGLSTYVIGQSGGTETVTLTTQQIPAHNHMLQVSSGTGGGSSNKPSGIIADQAGTVPGGGQLFLYAPGNSPGQTTIAPQTVGPAGGSQPHENIQPIITMSWIISLFGVYPSPT